MSKAAVYNLQGEKISDQELPSKVFDAAISPAVVHQVAVAEAANARNTVAHAKTRGEVSGGGRKPWKQKGTGRARAGSIRSPLWKGGGVTFGPRSKRNYSKKVNKSQFRSSISMVLSDRLAAGSLHVLKDFSLENPKTKELRVLVNNLKSKLKVKSSKIGIILPKTDKVVLQAARNLKSVVVMDVDKLSVSRLLSLPSIFITADSMPVLEKFITRKN